MKAGQNIDQYWSQRRQEYFVRLNAVADVEIEKRKVRRGIIQDLYSIESSVVNMRPLRTR